MAAIRRPSRAYQGTRNLFQRLLWPEDQGVDYSAGYNRPQDFARAITAILNRVDGEKTAFKWRVYWVAALGFLVDSYNLFASNIILPALAFVYWDWPTHKYETGFNLATLAGSAAGQIVFGVAVDVYGRRSLYGIELLIVIVSTMGLLQCSQGYYDVATGKHTWHITPWLIFWRTVMGFGIGAEYPLSACIAAEWSSTKHRGRMMALVFLMQPVGQLLAYIVGLAALNYLDDTKRDVDKLWRIVVGVGAAPTLLALVFRRNIPESWRFTYYVCRNPIKANNDMDRVYGGAPILPPLVSPVDTGVEMIERPTPQQPAVAAPVELPRAIAPAIPGSQFQWSELSRYLSKDRNWLHLLGTSVCWFLLDFAFYGMGFNSPGTLAKLWTSRRVQLESDAPWWQTSSNVVNTTVSGIDVINGTYANGTVADATIRQVLGDDMRHSIYTTSIAAIVGSVVFVAFVDRLDRRSMLWGTFAALAGLLAVTAGLFGVLFHDDNGHFVNGHYLLIFFWAVIQFLFSFGPNTLTFIIPAEIFPTRYRCTLYGIAAASGKIGAVVVQGVILGAPNLMAADSTQLKWLLAAFAVCMLLGASVAYFTIPHVQEKLHNISLEDLSDDHEVVQGVRAA